MLSDPPCAGNLVGCLPGDTSPSVGETFGTGSVRTFSSSFSSSVRSSARDAISNVDGSSSTLVSQLSSSGTGENLARMTIRELKPVESFKPYAAVPLPRTGASDYLFATIQNQSYTLTAKTSDFGGLAPAPIFILSCMSLFLVVIVAIRTFRHQKEQNVKF